MREVVNSASGKKGVYRGPTRRLERNHAEILQKISLPQSMLENDASASATSSGSVLLDEGGIEVRTPLPRKNTLEPGSAVEGEIPLCMSGVAITSDNTPSILSRVNTVGLQDGRQPAKRKKTRNQGLRPEQTAQDVKCSKTKALVEGRSAFANDNGKNRRSHHVSSVS